MRPLAFSQIQIQQSFGQIGLDYRPPHWQIHSPAVNLQIHSTDPQLDVQQTNGQLQIDQTQAFADAGRLKPLASTEDFVHKAEVTAQRNITETAQFGQQMLRSHDPRKTMQQWVSRYADRQPQTGPALVPRPFSVHVHYDLGHISEQLKNGQVTIHAQVQSPQLTVSLGSVRVYQERAASLQLTPPTLGSLVDQTA